MNAISPINLDRDDCPYCGTKLVPDPKAKPCAKCGASAVERAFAALAKGMLREYDPKTSATPVVLLAHRLSARETEMISALGKTLAPSTTSWYDIKDPAIMERVVSLSGTAAQTVDLFYSPPATLDFVPDVEKAVTNAGRVLRPSGVAVIGFNPGRIVDGAEAPAKKYKLDPAAYKLPADVEMWSMQLGRDWLIGHLRKLGLAPNLVHVSDPASGGKLEFFLGQRPAA